VVVAGSENAATELLEDGVNGVVSPDDSAEELGAALARTIAAGPALRESTGRWFAENAPRLTIDASLDVVAETYAAAAAVRSARR
jgi:glycosyltransferase involved in cell wall biosynthesis